MSVEQPTTSKIVTGNTKYFFDRLLSPGEKLVERLNSPLIGKLLSLYTDAELQDLVEAKQK